MNYRPKKAIRQVADNRPKGFRLSESAFAAFKARGPLPPLPDIPVFTPFLGACDAIGLHRPVAEYKFHPTRKWRFDWAWPLEQIAVEFQGAIWTHGKHSRGAGQLNDMRKLNAAQLLGWRCFYFMPSELTDAAATVRLMLIEWKVT